VTAHPKSFIVIIDNGQAYSDHTHWTALVCPTKDDAIRAVDLFQEWVRVAKEEYLASDCEKYTAVPPFWGKEDRYDFSDPGYYSAAWIEVPVWANS